MVWLLGLGPKGGSITNNLQLGSAAHGQKFLKLVAMKLKSRKMGQIGNTGRMAETEENQWVERGKGGE